LLRRRAAYSAAFLLTMLAFGDLRSWWSFAWRSGAVLIGFSASRGVGLAATSLHAIVRRLRLRSTWPMIPLFLFSATFFPLARYPAGLQA